MQQPVMTQPVIKLCCTMGLLIDAATGDSETCEQTQFAVTGCDPQGPRPCPVPDHHWEGPPHSMTDSSPWYAMMAPIAVNGEPPLHGIAVHLRVAAPPRE